MNKKAPVATLEDAINIRRLRKAGLTVREVCDRTGWSSSTVKTLTRNDWVPPVERQASAKAIEAVDHKSERDQEHEAHLAHIAASSGGKTFAWLTQEYLDLRFTERAPPRRLQFSGVYA